MALLSAPFGSDKDRLNIYIRIDDPGKIIAQDEMHVISSDFLSAWSPPFLSRLMEISVSRFAEMIEG
jgi:hypothetical protein